MPNEVNKMPITRNDYRSDEIDLRVIFDKIGNGINRIKKGIVYTINLSLRRIKLISVFVIVGLALGFILFKATKPYYTSTMTLVLADIRNEFVDDQLSKLVEMIEDDNFEAISQKLDITQESAMQIKDMTFSNLDENRIEEDSILTGSPFRIELKLYDNALFNSMEPALSNYLENNRYFSKQKRIKQRQVESIILKLKDEIKSIDSLKTTVATPRGPVNGFVYGEALDPTTLYRESVGMFKEQAELEAELNQLDNIQVVTGFSPRLRPTGPSLLKFLVISSAAFFLLGLIYAFLQEKRSKRYLHS
ncbi:chain length determinant protein [Pontibacter cellulosilyticus]|uniref:Chain length determinant protein n=1 Tax=Pontibacter cellulosilyticus TaxID=1720253 RepID=A0A923N4N7_9BACT|nr:chain length determinant protein [Pontibacter cellulosilyticus]MBC5992104.1 chain length determinant protein [Pontibacter cellulosilyticus]